MKKNNFESNPLWQRVFTETRNDGHDDERELMAECYKSMHRNVTHILNRKSIKMPTLILHDISHINTLWQMTSIIVDKNFEINPTEAFVLGASMLIHYAGLILTAHKNSISELRNNNIYKNLLIAEAENIGINPNTFNLENPPVELVRIVIPKILQKIHENGTRLLICNKFNIFGSEKYIIENSDIRDYYGNIISIISKNNWNFIDMKNEIKTKQLFSHKHLPSSKVDWIKLACVMRLADKIRVDLRQAPPFRFQLPYRNELIEQDCTSISRWMSPKHILIPKVDKIYHSLEYTSDHLFEKSESDAWWWLYETLCKINIELQVISSFFEEKSIGLLNVNCVKGITSPIELTTLIGVKGWSPMHIKIDTRVEHLLKNRFGDYNRNRDDPTIPIRELIKNAADAVLVRRDQKTPNYRGRITVGLKKSEKGVILYVEDNGVGMSKNEITELFFNFNKFLILYDNNSDNFLNLISRNMMSIGKFNLGFFSVFLLSSKIKIFTKKYNEKNIKSVLLLELIERSKLNPVLSYVNNSNIINNGGTRIEIFLEIEPFSSRGMLNPGLSSMPVERLSLGKLVGSLAPCLNVQLDIDEFGTKYMLSKENDWKYIKPSILLNRIDSRQHSIELFNKDRSHEQYYTNISDEIMSILTDRRGVEYGRAFINITNNLDNYDLYCYCIVNNGLTLSIKRGIICGVLFGQIENGYPKISIPSRVLSDWASKQADVFSNSFKSEEEQSSIAEVILQLGGDIKDLKFVKIGSSWYSQYEFSKYVQSVCELKMGPEIDVELSYTDEEENHILSLFHNDFEFASHNVSDIFRENFNYNSDILVSIQGLDAHELKSQLINMLTFKYANSEINENKTRKKIIEIIESTWNNNFIITNELKKIGKLFGKDIYRKIALFTRIEN